MLVFAFDRDWTVDVNPHPDHDAVPLEWVRHLAHETPHAVYAIGNQTLVEEAAIPGIVDIVDRHPDDSEQWLGGKQPDGRYERFPLRRERLALIADLHPAADGYIVVDDLDLSDVDGWDHFHAWEFVSAVEQDDIDTDLPVNRDPIPDGGRPTAAGIAPANASMLSSFLTEHANPPGYELTYTDGGETQTCVLWNVSLDAVRLEHPDERPAILCTPLSPGAAQFIVSLDAIELLSIIDPPPELYTADAEGLVEKTRALARLADAKPAAVDVSSLLELLDRDSERIVREQSAVRALRRVAAARPDDCTPAIPILRSLLADDEFTAAPDALATLRHIGTVDAGDIAPLADDILPYLTSNNVTARREATKCTAAIADEYPGDVVGAARDLATIVVDDADGQGHAIVALSHISEEYPDAIEAVEPLAGIALDESQSDGVRLHATAALGRVVSESPGVGVDIVEDVVGLFDEDNYKLRNNAIALLNDVAAIHTDVVEPYVDDIAALLVVDDTYTRINASGVLGRVAADFPATVEPMVPMVVRLLSDNDPRVRENACWILGQLSPPEASESLEETLQADENAAVRNRAAWALVQYDE